MTAIYYDATADAVVIAGIDVYQPHTLRAALGADGVTIIVTSLAGRGEWAGPWSSVTDEGGAGFGSAADVLAYLAAQFTMWRAVGTPERSYALAVADGQTVFPISPAPVDVNTVGLLVNGHFYAPPDIAVSSLAITWQGSFRLAATDAVRTSYF